MSDLFLLYVLPGIYFVITILVLLRIIYDTKTTSKTWGYIMLVVFVPLLGFIFYFTFGVNYRKRKLYNKKLFDDIAVQNQVHDMVLEQSEKLLENNSEMKTPQQKLARLVLHESISPLSDHNEVELLINGEQKFPEVLKCIKAAKEHIHVEYYIFRDDTIGNEIAEALIEKAKEGVSVKLIYDDYGSRSIRKKLVDKLRKAGVEASPFYEIKFMLFANRINYRNHRKIIVIDGHTAFVGGINISDRYTNRRAPKSLYWRDTHVKIKGEAVYYLQYLFLGDWNFCANQRIAPSRAFFPEIKTTEIKGDKLVQIAASGPDSDAPTILYSLVQAISGAQKTLFITNPYFIPDESILVAMVIAARRGVDIKLLLPGTSDSKIVSAAARSYYSQLLIAGVEIYHYHKGFVHAKTLVADGEIAMVGTANLDIRSFNLNFEVNAIIYDNDFAQKLQKVFFEDLKDADKILSEDWQKRTVLQRLPEKIARLLSSIL